MNFMHKKDMYNASNNKKRDVAISFKPVVQHQITKSITHNTSSRTNLSNAQDSSLVLAITEGRGFARCEVGIAAIDLMQPTLIVSQLSDNIWYTATLTKINIFNPVEILLPETILTAFPKPKLLEYIEDMFPNVSIKSIPRRHFVESDAIKLINDLCSAKYESAKLKVTKKYYALASISALLKYLQYVQNVSFNKNSLKLDYQNKYGTMMIDVETSHRLELLYQLSQSKEKKSNLFGILDNCSTPMGRRSLRAKILEPICDIPTITKIHECIKELMDKPDMLLPMKNVLGKFEKVERLMKLSVVVAQENNVKAAETMINQALLLKSCLESIPDILEILKDAESKSLVEIRDILSDPRYQQMLEKITSVLNVESHTGRGQFLYFQRLNAVKSDISVLLDLSRNFYSDSIDKLTEQIIDMGTTYNIPLRMVHSINRGFHIQLTFAKNASAPPIPQELTVLYTKLNSIFLTSDDVLKKNITIKELINEIQLTSNAVVSKLLLTVRQEIDAIYNLSGVITDLDIYQSLAHISMNDNYCCPTFGDDLRITDGVNPLLEHSWKKTNPVPNNVIATPEFNFFIITGPNMGGKTIYIKMIALIQIMAQLGCFVPAKEAQIRISDKLFSRIGFDDNMDAGASSFVIEIREMEYILKNITPNSLVIMDELCRSTNPQEGKELAWCLSERLIRFNGLNNDGTYFDDDNEMDTQQRKSRKTTLKTITSPFIFMTTHFLELSKLAHNNFGAVNLYLTAEQKLVDDTVRIDYNHKIEEGVTNISGYGVALARNVKFPSNVIPRAEEILKEMVFQDLPVNSRIREHENSILNGTVFTSTTTASISSFEIERKLYDLYSNIATIFRGNCDGNVEEILNKSLYDYVKSQPISMVKAFRDIAFSNKNSIIPDQTVTENLSHHSIVGRQLEEPERIEEDDSVSTIANEIIQIPEPSIQKSSYLKPVSPMELSRNLTLEDRVISQMISEENFNFDSTSSQIMSGCTDIYKRYKKISEMGTNTFVSKNVESSFFRNIENDDLPRSPQNSQISLLDPVKSEIDELLFSQQVDDDFNFEIPQINPRRTTDLIGAQSDFKFFESQSENRSKNSFFDFGASKRQRSKIDFFDFEKLKEIKTQPRSAVDDIIPWNPIVVPIEEELLFSKKSDYFHSSPSEVIDLTDVIDSEKQNKSKSVVTENPSNILISSSNSSHYNVSSSNINELESRSSSNVALGQSSDDCKMMERSKEFKNLIIEKNIRKAMSYKRSKVPDNKIYDSARVERLKYVKKINVISEPRTDNNSGILKNRGNNSMDSSTSKNSHSVRFAEPKYIQPVFYKPFDHKQKMIFDSWHKAKPYQKPRVPEIKTQNRQQEIGPSSVYVDKDVGTSIELASVAESPIKVTPVVSSIFTEFVDAPLRKPSRLVINKNVKCRTDPGIFID